MHCFFHIVKLILVLVLILTSKHIEKVTVLLLYFQFQLYDLLTALTMQMDELRSTVAAHGEQCVMITGTLTMLVLFADNLVFVML